MYNLVLFKKAPVRHSVGANPRRTTISQGHYKKVIGLGKGDGDGAFFITTNYINTSLLLISMVDIRITYETLFDLLRREKNREELQRLDKDFYEQVLAYLKEKKEALTKKGDELFVSAEREKLKIQFQNIRRIIKELYERREKKIINMAMSKARTGSDVIDTSNLLPSEKKFFEEQEGLLTKYKGSVLDAIIHLKEFNNGKKEEEKENAPPEGSKEGIRKEPEIKEKETTVAADAINIRKIKIIASLPEFVGLEGEVIGPFSKGDVVELEPQIAELLIKKGNAQASE